MSNKSNYNTKDGNDKSEILIQCTIYEKWNRNEKFLKTPTLNFDMFIQKTFD